MSLQLILGSSGAGKSFLLYQEIINESRKNIGDNYLVIVPEQFTLQTQKDIVSMHPDKGVMNLDILSFLRFSFRIFDEVGGNDFPILEDTGKNMILRKVIAKKKKDLILFGANAKKPGFINEIKSALSEIYQYSIGIDELEEMKMAVDNKPVLKAKLQDMITIYQGFEEFIRERYITAEEVLEVLYHVIDGSLWLKDSIICLDGFTGFTPSQYKIIEKMMQRAKKVYITVTIDPREKIVPVVSEHQLFSLSLKTINKLYEIADYTKTTIDSEIYAESSNGNRPYRFNDSKALAALEKNLFRYPYEVFQEKQEDITIHGMKEARSEVEFAAREIKRLVREEGYRYQDIAVVTGDIESYGSIAMRIFESEGIPCFVDYKREIINNPFAELLRAAIAITHEDFSYESVFRYLRTGLSGIAVEDVDNLENYVIACGIRGRKRYSEPFTRRYRSNETIDLEEINETRQMFIEEIEDLYIILKDKEKTIIDYTRALYDHGIKLDIAKKLEEYHLYFKENNMAIEAKEYDQVYKIVMELYDQMVLLLGDEHCNAQEFGEILDSGLVEAKVGVIPPGVDEIVVGDTKRTRLKDIRALFFIGVNEGIVPSSSHGGGVFSDIEREVLIENKFEIAPSKRQIAFTEQFYIYLNMTKPKNKLYITYHKLNEDGKSVRPSYLITRIMQLFDEIKIYDGYDGNSHIGSTKDILNDGGIKYLIGGLRGYPKVPLTPLWKELYIYYMENEEKQKIIKHLLDGAFYQNEDKGLSKEVAYMLYGKELKGSVTRLEKYAGCSFAHFLSYGLYLRERAEYKLAVPDIGNIFHGAIDLFSKRLGSSKYSWHDIPDETREEWAVESVESSVKEYENSFIKSTKRNEYLIERIKRITIRTLWALCNQIKQGSFIPVGYEMAFEHMPEDGIALRGSVDRLDLYEDDENIYVRVIDYKSGSTSFDFNSIYYGLQQQLSVYLTATMDYLKKQGKDKKIVPAGVFYYHIDDPIVAKTEQSELEIYKSLKMNGLINKNEMVLTLMDKSLGNEDGSLKPSVKSDIISVETNKGGTLTKRSTVASEKELKALMEFVNHKICQDSNKILDGDVSLNPYELKARRACDYCEYKAVCGFDSRLPQHKFRKLVVKTIDDIKNEIWKDEDENIDLDTDTDTDKDKNIDEDTDKDKNIDTDINKNTDEDNHEGMG